MLATSFTFLLSTYAIEYGRARRCQVLLTRSRGQKKAQALEGVQGLPEMRSCESSSQSSFRMAMMRLSGSVGLCMAEEWRSGKSVD
jgi:hypothetical protein